MPKSADKSRLGPEFYVSFVLAAGFLVWGLVFRHSLSDALASAFGFVVNTFGWAYLVIVFVILVFIIVLAITRFGRIRLGDTGERPEFGWPSWIAMLFSAGVGMSFLSWGASEPLIHFGDPPHGAAESSDAAVMGMRYSFMFWGLHAWVLYAAVAVAVGYASFRRGRPVLISSALYALLGRRINGPIGKTVDVLTVLAILFGIATSLGLGALNFNGGLSHAFGLPETYVIRISIIVGLMTVSTISALTGLGRGIRVLSLVNLGLCVALLLFVFVTGPTATLVGGIVDAIGSYGANFVHMSFDTGAKENNAWAKEWTFFFWAWWISWAPFVGSFIARISRGRTIRSIVIGVVGVPSLFSVLWFGVLGGTTLQRQRSGTSELTQIADSSKSAVAFDLFGTLPFYALTSVIVVIVLGLLFITSADSASFTLGSTTSGGSQTPPKPLRLMWSFGAAFAAVLLIGGGTSDLRAVAVISAVPFTVILIGLCVSLGKALFAHRHEAVNSS